MKSFFEDYSKLIGFILLTYVIIILLSTPSMIFAKSITTIGPEFSHTSRDETAVRAWIDFGRIEHMVECPERFGFGDWNSSDYYNTARIAESLSADVKLLCAYSHPRLHQPVLFLIMDSKNRSSFHSPIVYYTALGYTIEEEATEEVLVHNASLASKTPYSTWESRKEELGGFNGTISVKKLIVVKESGENGNKKVTERRVVLYFYVKESQAQYKVTMVRVSALAPIEGSYDGALNLTKDFIDEVIFPYMFEFELREEESNLFILLAFGSIIGKVAIVLLFLVPLSIIFYPQIRNRFKKSD